LPVPPTVSFKASRRPYCFGGESAGGVAVLSAGGVVVDESGVAAPVSAGGVAVLSAGGGTVDESAGGLADGEEDSCLAHADASNRAAILRTKALRFILITSLIKTDALKVRVAFPGQWQDHRAPGQSSTPCARRCHKSCSAAI
jgi:hypothetical protein